MIWKSKELITIGDLMEHGIDTCQSREEAREFMILYRADSPYADVNIGYLSGYYSNAEADRIREWFGVVHPIFGLGHPTPSQALKAGMEMGERNS